MIRRKLKDKCLLDRYTIAGGQSLIVWAIYKGHQAAYYLDKYLMGNSSLPLKDKNDLPRV